MSNPAPTPALATSVDATLRSKIPADVDAPDRLAFDLTFRQLVILTLTALTGLSVWVLVQAAAPMLAAPVRAVPLVPIAAVGFALAVGRRDGRPLDLWLAEAAVFTHQPQRQTPVATVDPPAWAPPARGAGAGPRPGRRSTARRGPQQPVGLLRLPADSIDADGTIRHQTSTATVLVAATTVNVALRTPTEQAALVAGLGRWLNGLTSSVQIVVSARRVDLVAHAVRLIDRAVHPTVGEGLDGSDLAAAATDHAEFLLELAETCDPLARTVTIAATATGGPSPATSARRTAEHTATALTALGCQAVVLDGRTTTSVLTAAADPYQAGDVGWNRTRPGAVVTGRVLLGDQS